MSTTTAKPKATASPPKFARVSGVQRGAHKIVIYGVGGIGKSELASRAPGALFIDLENGAVDLDVQRVTGIDTWGDLREFISVGDLTDVKTLVIDSATKAEEMCVAWVLTNVPHEKGQKIARIEDYGFGKGYTHVYGEFVKLLADLDRLWMKGINIVLVCHEAITAAPNPAGEDFKRYNLRLQNQNNGNVAAKTKEWADHVFFVTYDAAVKDKKARGEGSRTIYCTETPYRVAKVRHLPDAPIIYNKGDRAIWDLIEGKANAVDDDMPSLT